MRFKLKVIEGALKTPDGRSIGTEIPVPVRRFFIGTARDCHMRCSGQSISPHHCMILVEDDRVVVRDDASQGGTFINGVRINTTACLFHGDRLRIGKLEFEVVMSSASRSSAPVAPAVVLPQSQRDTVAQATDTVAQATDTLAELVVDLLLTEDEKERDRRRFDPATREFHLTNDTPANLEKTTASPAEKAKPPVKRPPTKLPTPPPLRGQDTVDAAEQALTRLLTPSSKKKSG